MGFGCVVFGDGRDLALELYVSERAGLRRLS